MDAAEETNTLGFYESARYRVTLSLALGVFLILFFLFFQPFGVNNYDPTQSITGEFVTIVSLFGGVVCLVSLANEFLLRPLVLRPTTPGAVMAWSIWTCLLLSQSLFLLYNALGGWHDWKISSAIRFFFDCSAVFAFPLVGTFFWFRYRDLNERLRRAIRRSNARPRSERTLVFEGQGSGDRLEIPSQDFRFARAQDNYVELNYLQGAEEKRTLIRSTLAATAEQAPEPHAVRCHRSYLVNLNAVTAVRGPKSALRLHLQGIDESIPVSRGFAAELEARLDATE
jgi:hypothetical protein